MDIDILIVKFRWEEYFFSGKNEKRPLLTKERPSSNCQDYIDSDYQDSVDIGVCDN